MTLAELAQAAIDAHERKRATIRFSVCMIPGRRHPEVIGYRSVTTDQPEVVAFLMGCWDNRAEIARLAGVKDDRWRDAHDMQQHAVALDRLAHQIARGEHDYIDLPRIKLGKVGD